MKNLGFDPGTKSQVNKVIEVMDSDASVESPVEETDPASYRDLTKAEVMDRIEEGYSDFLEGKFRPADECYDELGWQSPADET